MNRSEYNKLYSQARRRYPLITEDAMKRIRRVMEDASKSVQREIARAKLNDLSELTRESLESIDEQLRIAATKISEKVEKEVPKVITDSYSKGYAKIDTEYIMDQVLQTDAKGTITKAGLRSLSVAVNNNLILSLANRTYQDGYTFSDRVWLDMLPKILKNGESVLRPAGIFGDYQYRVKNILNAGLAQGRDVVDIAKDVEIYVSKELLDRGIDTKEVIFRPGRYGRLKPGTREYIRRIARRPDWRALRLVRSELYASLQDAGVFQAEFNPAATGYVDWVMTPGAKHSCICPDLQADSPYHVSNVPDYPHSNCLCHVVPALRPADEFRADLQAWATGEKVDYLDEWYNLKYLPAQ